MFRVRTLSVRRPISRPFPQAVPDNVMAFTTRSRALAKSDAELAQLLNEMDIFLPPRGPRG